MFILSKLFMKQQKYGQQNVSGQCLFGKENMKINCRKCTIAKMQSNYLDAAL